MTQDFGLTGVLGQRAHKRAMQLFFLARSWSQKTSQARVLLNSRCWSRTKTNPTTYW